MPAWLSALFALASLAFGFGAALGWARRHFRVSGQPLADAVDALLPQTQCEQCGYPGCRPYAEAVAAGDAINKCIPGGQAGVAKLAALTGRAVAPLAQAEKPKALAYIREDECIGCTKCIQACPVDAILGAAKQMHTVLSAECTGCELCVAPCPVDCIEMRPVAVGWRWPHPHIPVRAVA